MRQEWFRDTRLLRVVLILGVILGMSGVACTSRPDRVVIGVALTKTNHPGVLLAAEEINAGGGIDGVPLELMGLEWDDLDPSDPPDVLKWAARFGETENLVAVIGHSDSASTLSAAVSYNQAQIPQIVTIASNPDITNIGKWTYRLCLSDAVQGPALADYAVREWGKKTIAVFYANDAYGRGLAQLFENRVRELDGKIVTSVPHRNALQEEDQQSIQSIISGLQRGGAPDLITLFQRPPAAVWTLRAIRKAGLCSAVLGGDSLALGTLKDYGADLGLEEGLRTSTFFFPGPNNPGSQEFVKRFHKSNQGEEPHYGQAFAYDAVYMIRDALIGGGFSREGIKSYLDRSIVEKRVFRGATGPFTIGEDHDARRPLFIVEMRNGRPELVKTLDLVTADKRKPQINADEKSRR